MDSRWSEGGVVLDCDRKGLLFYGGEDILFDAPLRRLYLQGLPCSPAGRFGERNGASLIWRIILGRLAARLLGTGADRDLPPFAPPAELGWTDCVGSVTSEDGKIRLFPLHGDAPNFLLAGPSLVDAASEQGGYAFAPLTGWTDYPPHSGFHVDVSERKIVFWLTYACNQDPQAAVAAQWPDWNVR